MIIIVGDGEIKEEHLEVAKKNKVNVVKTHYDTFHTTKLINLSNYNMFIDLSEVIVWK